MKSDHRLPVLDGLRAISILLVLATHMLPLGPKFLQLNVTSGLMGMSLFFVLSGFLITSTLLHDPDMLNFLTKRLTRILPLAFAYLAFVFTVVVFDPKAMLWSAMFVTNYATEHVSDLNAHFWSLCVEVHFYLTIAVVVLVAGKRGIWIVWPACLIVTAARIGAGAYISIETHLRADEILAGACLATVFHSKWRDDARVPLSIVVLAAALWFLTSSPFGGPMQYARPYAAAALVAATLAQRSVLLTGVLVSAPMRYIAKISYALYVVHPLTVYGWWNEGSVFERYLLKRPFSFAITFGVAHLSTFYWERLWMQAGRKWIEQRKLRRLQSTAESSV